jgi:hypothetical protein
MQQVELTLEGLQQGSNKKYKKDDMVTEEFENRSIGENYPSGLVKGRDLKNLVEDTVWSKR